MLVSGCRSKILEHQTNFGHALFVVGVRPAAEVSVWTGAAALCARNGRQRSTDAIMPGDSRKSDALNLNDGQPRTPAMHWIFWHPRVPS